ncbi:MAG: hypothetical protein A2Y34_08850 [Spirochaetes bacterium GWC1_27_15]|nr:MAG: hypothetical protein A2Y34_08850 [Spirochaetes bacterium GWC1_27_15]
MDTYNTLSDIKLIELREIAFDMRTILLDFALKKRVHIGSSLSLIEILVSLYFLEMNYSVDNFKSEDRDRLILSKGHGALALYAVLYKRGILDKLSIDNFASNNSNLSEHPHDIVPGIEVSSGSLGHGLSIGAGISLASKIDMKDYNVYVIMGDGELNEGTVWEAITFAAHQSLNNLIVIIDKNNLQQEGKTKNILSMEPLESKWESFGWHVKTINGHDFQEIKNALEDFKLINNKPKVIIANTIKGKGVSFMENNPHFHMAKLNQEEYIKAKNELN